LAEPDKNWHQSFFVAILFALILMALRPLDGPLQRSRILRPLWLCGAMCYSLYLVHMPVIEIARVLSLHYGFVSATSNTWLTMLMYSATSLAIAWVFYVVVEQRFLNRPLRALPMPNAGDTRAMFAESPILERAWQP
jgi:peptidoglycan/LPS O-acetylase OafA/YrhL